MPVLVHNYNNKIPWSSKEVKTAAEELANGSKSVYVTTRSQAEELFLRLYQGYGYRNTDGWKGEEIDFVYGNKGGTYHWDIEFEYNDEIKDYILKRHGINNPDAKIAHLQIHTFDDLDIIRIFITGIKPLTGIKP